jgi:hypothetical protein
MAVLSEQLCINFTCCCWAGRRPASSELIFGKDYRKYLPNKYIVKEGKYTHHVAQIQHLYTLFLSSS